MKQEGDQKMGWADTSDLIPRSLNLGTRIVYTRQPTDLLLPLTFSGCLPFYRDTYTRALTAVCIRQAPTQPPGAAQDPLLPTPLLGGWACFTTGPLGSGGAAVPLCSVSSRGSLAIEEHAERQTWGCISSQVAAKALERGPGRDRRRGRDVGVLISPHLTRRVFRLPISFHVNSPPE